MEDHAFNRLSFVNGKVYGKYGKKNAGQKNPGYYQKNLDHRETKYPSQTRSITPIICTGYSSLIDEEKAEQLGIAGYVMKPISMAKIAKIIRKVLNK